MDVKRWLIEFIPLAELESSSGLMHVHSVLDTYLTFTISVRIGQSPYNRSTLTFDVYV